METTPTKARQMTDRYSHYLRGITGALATGSVMGMLALLAISILTGTDMYAVLALGLAAVTTAAAIPAMYFDARGR